VSSTTVPVGTSGRQRPYLNWKHRRAPDNGDELQIGKFKLVFLQGGSERIERSLSIGRRQPLQDEPDITISKIRFLSRGLLDPESAPSGYRKFYEEDIERLRWILRQKENFSRSR
jgi:hypothetical protein